MKSCTIQNLLIASFSLAVVVVHIAFTADSIGQTTFDDAFMITRYANHWLAGNGFSWNGVDGPSFGVTSPIYLFLITLVLGTTSLADATALTLTSYGAGLLSVFTLVLLGFLVQGNRRSPRSWAPLLTAPALLLVHPFPEHSLTGMETTLSLFVNALLACTMVVAARREGRVAFVCCLGAGLLAFMTRPDNGLYALALPPLFFVATDRARWKHAVVYVAALSVLIGLSLALNKVCFGDFLPLPFYAKSGGFYDGYIGAYQWNVARYMFTICAAATPFLLVIVVTLSRKSAAQVAAVLLVVGATFLYYGTVMQIMGGQARYYYPSLAFIVLAAYVSVYTRDEEQAPCLGLGPHFALGLMVLIPALSTSLETKAARIWDTVIIGEPAPIQSAARYETAASEPLPPFDWWTKIEVVSRMLEGMPPEITIAASEYGYIGAQHPDLPIVDLAGLHDRTLAHHGFDAAYIMSREPDLIWFPHLHYTGAVAALRDDPVFQRDYEYYPAVLDYGVALRKTSKAYPAIKAAFEATFAEHYPEWHLPDYRANLSTIPVPESQANAVSSR